MLYCHHGMVNKSHNVHLQSFENQTHYMDTYLMEDLEVCDFNSENSIDLPRVLKKEEIPVSISDIPKADDASPDGSAV